MSWQAPPVLVLFQIATVLSLVVVLYALNFVRQNGRNPTVILAGALGVSLVVMTTAATVKVASLDLDLKMTMYVVEVVGAILAQLLLLVLIVYFTGRRHWLKPWVGAFLLVPTVGLVALVVFNPYELLFIDPVLVPHGEFVTLEHGFGPLFMVGFGWVMAFPLASISLLAYDALRDNLAGSPAVVLMGAIAAPSLTQSLKVFGIYPSGGVGINVTPAVTGVALAAIIFVVFHSRVVGLLPVAKDTAIKTMQEGYLVVDEKGRIVDSNLSAREMLGLDSPHDTTGRSLAGLVPDVDWNDDVLEFTHDGRAIRSTASRLDVDVRREGRLYILHDITALREREQRIETELSSKRRVMSLLTEISSRRSLEETVCRLLVEHHGFDVAFVARAGVPSAEGGSLEVVTGDASDDDWTAVVHADRLEGSVTVSALADGTRVEARRSAHHPHAFGLGWGYAVPIAHGGVTYGVLSVLAETGDARSTSVVDEFADAVALSTFTSLQRDILQNDRVVRLAVTIGDPDHHLVGLSERLECRPPCELLVHEMRSRGHKTKVQLVELGGVEISAVREACTQIAGIERVETVRDDDDLRLVKLVVSTPLVAEVLEGYGVRIESVTACEGRAEAIVEVGRRTDLTAIVEAIEAVWPDSHVRSKHLHRVDADRPDLPLGLTDKQREALEVAYLLGFFERPQQATAEEVSKALGVSRATALQHIRAAEQKVFETLFSTRVTERPPPLADESRPR